MEPTLFEKILATNIVNFFIVIGTLVLIFKKAHLGDLIQKMADDIRLEVEKSSQNAQNAISEYKATKKAVKDTPKIQEEIISSAKDSAQSLKEKIEEKTSLTQAELKSGLEKIQKNQIEKYTKLTINEIYHASIDLAMDETIVRLNKDAHKRLINTSIEELDKIEGSVF